MSKQFKGGTCVYCAEPGASQTGDHVIARKFFSEQKRGGLPIVPSCYKCNSAKSALELYAMSVMPFGATHADAGSVLETMVARRLEKNRKLAETLARGREIHYVSRDGGATWETEMRLPFAGEKLADLFSMITRGLAFAHFGVILPEAECAVEAGFVREVGRAFFEPLFAMNARKTGRIELGDGIFLYEGLQALDSPQLTVWRMSLGGAILSGDPDSPMEKVSTAYALTAPRRMRATTEFAKFLRGNRTSTGAAV
jgi:hypothetical protein